MTSDLSTQATSTPTRSRTLALGAARALMALLGAATVAGATYFTFVAAPEQGGVAGPVDAALGAWALVMGVALVAAAVRLGRSASAHAVRVAAALVAAHVLFNIIKIIGYAETEALTFLAVDAAILGLLAAGRRTR